MPLGYRLSRPKLRQTGASVQGILQFFVQERQPFEAATALGTVAQMPVEAWWALSFENCNEVFFNSLTHAYIQAYEGQDATKGMTRVTIRLVKMPEELMRMSLYM